MDDICTCIVSMRMRECIPMCVLYKSWKQDYLCVKVLIVELVDQKCQYLDTIYLLNFDRIVFLTRNMTTHL